MKPRRGGWSAPRPGRFTPEKDPVPIVQEAEWDSRPVWSCTENASHWDSIPDRQGRSKLLHRLRCPSRHVVQTLRIKHTSKNTFFIIARRSEIEGYIIGLCSLLVLTHEPTGKCILIYDRII